MDVHQSCQQINSTTQCSSDLGDGLGCGEGASCAPPPGKSLQSTYDARFSGGSGTFETQMQRCFLAYKLRFRGLDLVLLDDLSGSSSESALLRGERSSENLVLSRWVSDRHVEVKVALRDRPGHARRHASPDSPLSCRYAVGTCRGEEQVDGRLYVE